MISRLIEAKPEELRLFHRRSSRYSRYKDRRRETENRIRRTQENLSRLTACVRNWSVSWHLHRQAQAAEKYKEFKAEERSSRPSCSAALADPERAGRPA
ncbi:hypothetical protein ULF88_18270 [Halopseudomonas pachastrellae]|nr:hypothetical protein [Halopseudomonas pachastrellae]